MPEKTPLITSAVVFGVTFVLPWTERSFSSVSVMGSLPFRRARCARTCGERLLIIFRYQLAMTYPDSILVPILCHIIFRWLLQVEDEETEYEHQEREWTTRGKGPCSSMNITSRDSSLLTTYNYEMKAMISDMTLGAEQRRTSSISIPCCQP